MDAAQDGGPFPTAEEHRRRPILSRDAWIELLVAGGTIGALAVIVYLGFGRQIANSFKRSTFSGATGSVAATSQVESQDYTGISDDYSAGR